MVSPYDGNRAACSEMMFQGVYNLGFHNESIECNDASFVGLVLKLITII